MHEIKPDVPAGGWSRANLKHAFNIAIIIALMAVGLLVFDAPLQDWLIHGQLIKARLAEWGTAAPAIFSLGVALLTAIGMPRLVLCSIGGLAFGAWGIIWNQLGTLAGSYIAFLLVRWGGREIILRKYPKLDRFSKRIEQRGVFAVLLIRQMPMNGFYNNVLLGLTAVTHRDFLLGSFLGFLPLGVAATLVGAGMIQTKAVHLMQHVLVAALCALVLGFLLKWMLHSPRSPIARSPNPELVLADDLATAAPRACNAEDMPEENRNMAFRAD